MLLGAARRLTAPAARTVPAVSSETLHPAETKHDENVLSFRRTQSIRAPAARINAAYTANRPIRHARDPAGRA